MHSSKCKAKLSFYPENFNTVHCTKIMAPLTLTWKMNQFRPALYKIPNPDLNRHLNVKSDPDRRYTDPQHSQHCINLRIMN
jgi:hypothetical protein